MAWFAEGHIDISYVLPKTDWHLSGIVPSQFDHTFYFGQNTSINSKRKVKLSMNHQAKAAKDQSSEPSPTSPSADSTAHARTDSNASNDANTSKSDLKSKAATLSELTHNYEVSDLGRKTESKARLIPVRAIIGQKNPRCQYLLVTFTFPVKALR